MSETVIKIEGMSCQHCVMRVKKALDGIAGITEANVTIGGANIKYDESKVKMEDIYSAVGKAGYKVSGLL
ncbi:MAG TPA: heavy-metal-associated domain-containing protein [Dissulfurispiraceae bacterium]|nr:heavy-metal-associated domain-containing protein [Dissulfurispiraceae bacterium]